MFNASFQALHFAVRPRVLCRYLGQILLLLAGLATVPTIVAGVGGELAVALRYAAIVALFGVLGLAGSRVRSSDRMQANEALVISALVFVLPGLAMAFPLMAYGIAPIDAVFEAISGVTTTGLSTLGSVEDRPATFLFGRAWLQWTGGLGVVVFALAIMIPSGIAAKHLGFGEREAADYVGGTRGHARRILFVYLGLTAVGILLCVAVGMDLFDALAHTLAAVSTGGFATRDESLAGLDPAARSVVSLICLAGAVSFSVYYRGSLRHAWRDARLWMLLGLTALATGALGLALTVVRPDPVADASDLTIWGQAAWIAVSAQSTAGFSTLPVESLPASGKLVLIASMLVGGEVGSTAGGLKILRLLILVRLVSARVLRPSMPRSSHLPLRVDGQALERHEIEAAAGLALAYAATLFASWLAFVAYGHDPLDALFDVSSALGTVGLSAGTVGPDLEPALKIVLCLDMLMGRVELFAFWILFFPGTWIGRRRAAT